ncbi:hypothetical protein BANRA_00698 [Escherichia coli]|nr:hypothetical protein BANRA_00698 [Escherichia coli]
MEVNPNKIIENISATCVKITPHEINRKHKQNKNNFALIFYGRNRNFIGQTTNKERECADLWDC